MNNSWYAPLALISSLGSQHRGVSSLGELHQARQEHLAQFFTTADIVGLLWRIVSPAIDKACQGGAKVALLDNSIGSARMFQYADPKKHSLAGCDVHADSVAAVAQATTIAGFSTDIICAGMEEVSPRGYGVAFINPPFSIHLESPHLAPFSCCTHGKFGPGTACLSHIYAVAQALNAADIVAAVLPLSFVESLQGDEFFAQRLCYVGTLPSNAFLDEGASVRTAIVVWDRLPRSCAVVIENIREISTFEAPVLGLTCRNEERSSPSPLMRAGLEFSEPTIKTPITGNPAVGVVRHNRRVILKFQCGLTEAKVLNALYVDHALTGETRLPTGVQFIGQGKFDLHVHLLQRDPVDSFQSLVQEIRDAGGIPQVDPGILGYLQRMGRRIVRHNVPFSHVIKAEGVQLAGENVELIARASFMLNPKLWGGPAVKKGQVVNARRLSAGRWTVLAAGKEWVYTDEEANQKFEIPTQTLQNAWIEKFAGRTKANPVLAGEARARAERRGISEWLNWDYQMADLVEIAISPFGAVVCWDMGIGKTRAATALMLLSDAPHNLHVTEAHLVLEVVMELEAIGLPKSEWQVVDSPDALGTLKKINIISYNRLRQPVISARKKFTYGKALRRRIGTMVCDEGHCLRNLDTEQTKAAWSVCAKRRYIFTGTVVANYPRDTLAILAWVGGSATACQPFGIRGDAYLEDRMIHSMSCSERGVDRFRHDFITLEWVTNQFAEDLQSGAKREVPKIANLPKYRMMLAPFIKRRVKQEPDVSKYVKTPEARESVVNIDWSDAHLSYYLKVADQFAQWFRDAKRKAGANECNVNLIALLARIGAVETACNVPQAGIEGFGVFSGLTSKQEFAVNHIKKLVAAGHKIIVYGKRPVLLRAIERELAKENIESVLVVGDIDIAERTKELRERFRFGTTPVLLASLGCTQTGLNIPEADRIIYLSRDWSAKTERQANARALRPQQKKRVEIEYLHLPGSIDDYQHQMVAFKGDAADAGLDWATPKKENEEFAHLDTILGKFVEDISKLIGVKPSELREYLSSKAA